MVGLVMGCWGVGEGDGSEAGADVLCCSSCPALEVDGELGTLAIRVGTEAEDDGADAAEGAIPCQRLLPPYCLRGGRSPRLIDVPRYSGIGVFQSM